MTKSFVLVGFEPDRSEYIDTADTTNSTRITFATKSPTVKVGGSQVRMVNSTITVVEPFSVLDCDNKCVVGTLNDSIKVQVNVKYGDATSITRMRAELNALLDTWQANNMAYGIVPPINTVLNVSGG